MKTSLDATLYCFADVGLQVGISGGLEVGQTGSQLTIYSADDPARMSAGDVPAGLVALLERMLEVARAGYQPEEDGRAPGAAVEESA